MTGMEAGRRSSRLPVLIGGVIAAAAAALLPLVLAIEDSLTEALVADHVAVELAAERQRLGLFVEEVRRAEASVARLAIALSATEAELTSERVPLSDRVRRDGDGSRRSPRLRFDPSTQAGIWIPPSAKLSPSDERFFVRAERIIALFGLGAYNNLFFDSWLLPLVNGEVAFAPDLPEFIYDAGPEQDYRDTDWVQLTNPAVNATGMPRWTAPSYDPVARKWMISVVAPVYVEGRWAGSVGHDLWLSTMLHTFLPPGPEAEKLPGALHVVAGSDLLVASSTFGERIAASGGALKVEDVGDAALRDRVAQSRERLTTAGPDESLVWHSEDDYVLATTLPVMDGLVLRSIPSAAIERQLARPLALLRLVLFGSVCVTLALVLALVLREDRRRRQLETALLDQNARLEQHVAERIEELRTTNEALRTAKDNAEAAARAKADFLAVMSHEIRTPMNGVLGMTRLALGEGLPPVVRERLTLAVSSAEALLTILDDILDLSKLEAGRLEFEYTPFVLRPLLDGIIDLMQNRAREKGLTLGLETAAGLPETVAGDPARLRQVLLNLVGNALKFSDSGRVAVRVRMAAAGELLFEVEDQGIGMDPATTARVFDDFAQADVSISRRFGGTGLGLAICKRLVEGQGGTIGVDSAPGKGSRFWFRVPMAPAELPLVATSSAGVVTLPPLAILLAEDNEVNRLVALGFLTQGGHQVATARDGREAVARVAEGGFDLVLMDMRMPAMDGLEATRAIRALPPPAGRVPIIALTANAMLEDVERCRAAGMDDHVAKPIDPPELVATIARVLGIEPAASVNAPSELAAFLGQDELAELMEMFLADGAARMARLTTQAGQPDGFDEVVEQAHALKGMAGYMGCPDLAGAAREVEQAGRRRDATELPELMRQLSAHWQLAERQVVADLAAVRQ